MKSRRQTVILELVDGESPRSQEELRRGLRHRGFHATQATISRDIAELGLVKHAGGAYMRPGAEPANSHIAKTALERAAAEYLTQVDCVEQLVVLKTGVGQAQPLALAIDRTRLPEAVGTIAGDDTILIVARDARRAAALAKRFEAYAAK